MLPSEQAIPPTLKANQIWLVIYECRVEAIRISLSGKGFFAPGQEPIWMLNNVQEWIKCLYDPELEEEEILSKIDD